MPLRPFTSLLMRMTPSETGGTAGVDFFFLQRQADATLLHFGQILPLSVEYTRRDFFSIFPTYQDARAFMKIYGSDRTADDL